MDGHLGLEKWCIAFADCHGRIVEIIGVELGKSLGRSQGVVDPKDPFPEGDRVAESGDSRRFTLSIDGQNPLRVSKCVAIIR
jgi:hypothetical protein